MSPVESEADRASYFDNDEFAQVGLIRGDSIDGFFDEPTEFLDDLATVSIQSTAPTFQCQSSELPSDIDEGEPITITRDDGTEFEGEVMTIEPDGFGMSVMRLKVNG